MISAPPALAKLDTMPQLSRQVDIAAIFGCAVELPEVVPAFADLSFVVFGAVQVPDRFAVLALTERVELAIDVTSNSCAACALRDNERH